MDPAVLGVDEDVSDDLAVLDSMEADDGVSIRVPTPCDFDQGRNVQISVSCDELGYRTDLLVCVAEADRTGDDRGDLFPVLCKGLIVQHHPHVFGVDGVVLGFPIHGQSDDPSISLERAA